MNWLGRTAVAVLAASTTWLPAACSAQVRPASQDRSPSPLIAEPTATVIGAKPTLPQPVECPDCWRPAVRTSWQWQLSGSVDTTVDAEVFDIDLFDNGASVVDALHAQGRRVVCYTSAGSLEDWRPDAANFPGAIVGKRLDGWAGERWLDVRARRVLRPLMQARIDQCAAKGFDGVEFDNVDGWSNDTGFAISRADQLRYNVMLANLAHSAGLSVALKNDVEQVLRLEPYFDMHLDEECFTYDECQRLAPFTDAGKPVFVVEYRLAAENFCPQANAMDLNAMRKRLNLGAWREPCR